eukprot:c53343_g1_i1 orf=173-790(-)
MGNRLACIRCTPHLSTLKVFHAENGSITEFHEPMTVAELMLDFPNHFVCHSTALHSAQRISPLSADQALELEQAYILFPMHKMHARFCTEERALVSSVFSTSIIRGKQPKHCQSKVTPLRIDWHTLAKEGTEEAAEAKQRPVSHSPSRANTFQVGGSVELHRGGGTHHLIRRSKSWTPKLETITESSLSQNRVLQWLGVALPFST